MKSLAVACALAVFAAQTGCGQGVPAWRLPEPPREDLRRGLGRVAVVVEEAAVPGFPPPPLAGACTLAALGSLLGMAFGFAIGLPIMGAAGHCTGGDPFTACLAVCILTLGIAVSLTGAALGALIGAIDGAFKGRSAEEVEAGRRILAAAAAKAALAPLLQAGLVEELRHQTRLPLVDPSQADTLLEIGSPRVFLAGPLQSDPPLIAVGDVRFRLRRPSARVPLHEITLGFRGTTKKFDQWTAAEGEAFRREILLGVSGFPARTVEELFLLEREAP